MASRSFSHASSQRLAKLAQLLVPWAAAEAVADRALAPVDTALEDPRLAAGDAQRPNPPFARRRHPQSGRPARRLFGG